MKLGISIAALIFTAVLGGMRITYGMDVWKGKARPFYRVWEEKTLYLGLCFWLAMFGAVWFLAGGRTGLWQDSRCLYAVRLSDLMATYVVLAVIDGRKQIVSDRVLGCCFLGQMLLGAACERPEELLSCLAGGAVFTVVIILLACISKGKFGLGDAKLLGVTAMTAGVVYTIQIACAGLLVSFFYSLWMLLFRKMSSKTEIPFVPFLTLGMIINTIYFVL